MADKITPNKRGLPLVVDFLKEIYNIWVIERPNQLAAALAYFGLFSFAPVIYIALSIAGIFFQEAEVLERFMTRLEAAFGSSMALAVQEMLDNVAATPPESKFVMSVVSFFFLLLAASGVFYQLQFVLNTIWKVPVSPEGSMLRTVRQQLFSFLMVIAVGLLLVAASVLSFIVSWLSSIFKLSGLESSLTALGFMSLAMLSFAVMYKLLPKVKIAWRDVWAGAAVAAFMVTVGGLVIVFIVKNTSFASALEAAGSFVVLLSGFYYFAQIFLFGAILTRVYAQRFGSMHKIATDSPTR